MTFPFVAISRNLFMRYLMQFDWKLLLKLILACFLVSHRDKRRWNNGLEIRVNQKIENLKIFASSFKAIKMLTIEKTKILMIIQLSYHFAFRYLSPLFISKIDSWISLHIKMHGRKRDNSHVCQFKIKSPSINSQPFRLRLTNIYKASNSWFDKWIHFQCKCLKTTKIFSISHSHFTTFSALFLVFAVSHFSLRMKTLWHLAQSFSLAMNFELCKSHLANFQ